MKPASVVPDLVMATQAAMVTQGLVLHEWGSTRHSVLSFASTGRSNLAALLPRAGVPWRRAQREMHVLVGWNRQRDCWGLAWAPAWGT